MNAEESVQISQTVKAAKNDCAERTLRRAYANIGVNLSFKILPTKRALQESNSGQTDGETARMEGVAQAYPNLIQIPVPICQIKFYIVVRPEVTITSLVELKDFQVGVVRGHLAAEKLAEGFDTTKFNDIPSLIQMINRKRIDAIIVSNSGLNNIRLDKTINDFSVIELPEETQYLYHYLHKRHIKLVNRLTIEMKKLEASGFTAKSIAEHETYSQEQARLSHENKRTSD